MKGSALKTILLHAAVTLACAAALYPVLWVVRLALSPSQELTLSGNPFPTALSLDNLRAVLGAHDSAGRWVFGRQLGISLAVSSASTLIGLAFAITAAYAGSRWRFPGRDASLRMLLVTQMFPPVLMLIPLYAILQRLHLLNSIGGLVLVYSTSSLPFCVWMLKGYFDTLPRDLEEAALLDGASPFQVLWKVVLPLARPALAVTALFAFMTAWNEFILAATLINDASLFTLPVGIQRYIGEYQAEWGRFAAAALVVSAPVMALFFFLQRHLVGGLTAGAVKG